MKKQHLQDYLPLINNALLNRRIDKNDLPAIFREKLCVAVSAADGP